MGADYFGAELSCTRNFETPAATVHRTTASRRLPTRRRSCATIVVDDISGPRDSLLRSLASVRRYASNNNAEHPSRRPPGNYGHKPGVVSHVAAQLLFCWPLNRRAQNGAGSRGTRADAPSGVDSKTNDFKRRGPRTKGLNDTAE